MQAQPGLSSARMVSGLDTLFDLVDLRVKNLRVPILLVVFQIGAVTLAVLAGVGLPRRSRARRSSSRCCTAAASPAAPCSRRKARRRCSTRRSRSRSGCCWGSGSPSSPDGSTASSSLASSSPPGSTTARSGSGSPWRLVGALVLLALSAPAVSRTVIEERRRASREDRPLLARVPVELIVLPLGIFAFIQLRGGTKPEAGEGAIEPLVLAAPTLLLFAASFIALRLLSFVLRRLDGRIGRARRLPTYLAGRRLGRSPGTGFAAALLLLLSMGLLVLATSYRAIVLQNHSDAAHVQVGADWSVSATPPDQVLAAVGSMPPETMALVRTDPAFSSASFSLPPTALGIDPARFEEAGWWRDDFSSTSLDDILERLDTEPLGVEVPEGATELTMTVEVPRAADELQRAGDVGGGRRASSRRPRSRSSRGPQEVALAASRGRAPAVDHVPGGHRHRSPRRDRGRDRRAAGSATRRSTSRAWQPTTWRGSIGHARARPRRVRALHLPSRGWQRGRRAHAGRARLPALVSDNVATQTGGMVEVGLAGQRLQVEPVAVASQFPGVVPNAPFVVVPVRGLLERQFSIPEAGVTLNEVWANTPEDPSPLLAEAGWVPGVVNATAPIEGLLAQLPQSLAVGMNFAAAVAGVGLVIIGVAAGLYFTMRRRDYEFAALRAMGTDRRQIRTTLVLEQAALLGFALLAGLAIGYWLLRLVMPYVGTSLGVSYPAPVLVLDWPAIGAAVVAIVVASAIALGAAMRTLMRSSVTGVLRGEAE